jgi:hypothetical protein
MKKKAAAPGHAKLPRGFYPGSFLQVNILSVP